jgi:hypothetical protein
MSETTKTRLALIDGDIILYQASFKSKTGQGPSFEIGEGFFSSKGVDAGKEDERTWEQVKTDVDELVNSILEGAGCSSYIGFLSPSRKTNFRSKVAFSKEYKGSRKNKEVPKYFGEIKEYLQYRWGFRKLGVIETDDALVILQKHYLNSSKVTSVICTKDKDLKQTTGWNYNWTTNEMRFIETEEAWRLLWKQVLTGDDGDDIVGCGDYKLKYIGQKLLAESGRYVVDKEIEEETSMTFKTKASRDRHIRQLLKDALHDETKAKWLKTEFDLEPELRKDGIGPVEADTILDSVKSNQYPARVLNEFIARFGGRRGIDKYHESFSLINMVPDEEYAVGLGEDRSLLSPSFMAKQEEEYDDEF